MALIRNPESPCDQNEPIAVKSHYIAIQDGGYYVDLHGIKSCVQLELRIINSRVRLSLSVQYVVVLHSFHYTLLLD